MTLELIDPTAAYQDAFLAMIEDYQASDERSYRGNEFESARRDFERYLEDLQHQARGVGLVAGYVPQNTYWLVKDNSELVGSIRLRHRLTAQLEHHGGHIGYDIRPSARRQGYGTQQLALALDKARGLGLTRIMVSCDVENIASARIIVANGGVLASEGISNVTNKLIARYWITL